jgi:aminopeptidase N
MIVADARDGMEYPMLTLDGGFSPGYYGLFAHEVGHNWFFGMVGNNETYRASLDEGFTQFLTNWCMTSLFGEIKPTKKNKYPVTRMDQTVYNGYLRDAMNESDMPLNTHSDDFNSALNHGGGYGHVYYKTATMLYNLQYVLGDALFISAMKHYFNQWKMCHPYPEDFRNSIIQFTHVDLNWFFDQWMETNKHIDYSVDLVMNYTHKPSEIYFSRRGEMQMPIDFKVYTSDSVYSFHIPNTYFIKKTEPGATILPQWKGWGKLNETYVAKINMSSKIKNVVIDTSYRLADIYQYDNSYNPPSRFIFDNGKRRPFNRKVYTHAWRPDAWYNSIDGIKLGLHFNGEYANRYDVYHITTWYNSRIGKDYNGSARNEINYVLSYRDAIGKNSNYYLELKGLDGLSGLKFGLQFEARKDITFDFYYKSLQRLASSDIDYLLYKNQWNDTKNNGTMNVDMQKNYQGIYNNGYVRLELRSSFFSDFDYSRISYSWINHANIIGKFELHSRLFLQNMAGSNPAPESMLNAAGGTVEEMMENKYLRARAFVPINWLGYGNTYNHFHFGGGLNLRGYAGYLLPVSADQTQYYLYTGLNGAALNMELDFDKLFVSASRPANPYFHIDSYFFLDAGIIENTFKQNKAGVETKKNMNTPILLSGGNGFAFTIKKFANFDKAKPLTLRVDFPWYVSNTPFVENKNINFRWVIGINRSF